MAAGPKRVGNVTAGLLVGAALLVDGLQFLLTLTVVGSVVASVVTPIVAFCFWLAFAMMRVKYTGKGGRKLMIAFASVIAELVPFVNALPATTLGVIGIIVESRIEDGRTNAGKKVTKNTAMAEVRRLRLEGMKRQRELAAANERAAAQEARHASANDNAPAANENAPYSIRDTA